jgi:hypothetical protein
MPEPPIAVEATRKNFPELVLADARTGPALATGATGERGNPALASPFAKSWVRDGQVAVAFSVLDSLPDERARHWRRMLFDHQGPGA